MADKEDAALSGWGGLTTSSFEDSTFGQGHLLPSASTSRCAEEEEAVVNAPQPDTANDPCVDDELRQQWRRNKPGRKPETRNQQKQQQPRRSKQPTQPTQPKPTVARAARAVHHTHTARLRPSFEGGLPASPGVPVVDLDCQEVPRSDSDAQQQPCSPTVLRERVVVDRGYNPNVRPARADHAPGTHRMTSAAGQSDKQLPGVQNSRPAIHVVHGTGNVTHATPQTQQMPVETAHAESRPAENAEVLKLRRFLAAIEPKMVVYAETLQRAGVGMGQHGGVDRWLREGDTHNSAVADLVALSTSARMELPEAKMFVEAVVTHREAGFVPSEILECTEEGPQPKLDSDRMGHGAEPSQPPGHAANVAESNSETDDSRCQNLNTARLFTMNIDKTAARTAARGGTVSSRGVLSSGFRLVPMSDEELRRKQSFASHIKRELGGQSTAAVAVAASADQTAARKSKSRRKAPTPRFPMAPEPEQELESEPEPENVAGFDLSMIPQAVPDSTTFDPTTPRKPMTQPRPMQSSPQKWDADPATSPTRRSGGGKQGPTTSAIRRSPLQFPHAHARPATESADITAHAQLVLHPAPTTSAASIGGSKAEAAVGMQDADQDKGVDGALGVACRGASATAVEDRAQATVEGTQEGDGTGDSQPAAVSESTSSAATLEERIVSPRGNTVVESWDIVVPNAAVIKASSSPQLRQQLPSGVASPLGCERAPSISAGIVYKRGDTRDGHHDKPAGQAHAQLRHGRSVGRSLAHEGGAGGNSGSPRVQISNTFQAIVRDPRRSQLAAHRGTGREVGQELSDRIGASSWRALRPPRQIAAAARRDLQSERGRTSITDGDDKTMATLGRGSMGGMRA